ncbi:MAG: hypothetical protein IJD80_07560 [Oscillospiraceae bacterium]|nr:hypothetical protein [Oscillospiraceae bacterium]
MKIELTVLISVLTAVAGMVLGMISAQRTRRQDIARQSRETATIISEIGYVKAGIDDIKRRQEKQDERHYSLAARVSKIEASMSAHIM